MAAFPSASVEEAGLFLLDPAELPPEWGFAPGSLPFIGASPDAMLRHHTGKQQPIYLRCSAWVNCNLEELRGFCIFLAQIAPSRLLENSSVLTATIKYQMY